MFVLTPAKYGPALQEVVDFDRLGDLGPGSPRQSVASRLNALGPQDVVQPHPVTDRDMASCCLAGLWLWNDFLEESHVISQSIDSSEGSYWHGIMHRREPDYSNGKYWFRRVGDHPLFPILAENAAEIAVTEGVTGKAAYLAEGRDWDPFRFIDLCEAIANGADSHRTLCQQIARVEWALLYDHCFHAATT